MSYPTEPTKIHIVLGVIAFGVFVALVVLDALPNYDVSIYLSALLVLSYLVLLGFGVVIQRLFEARYGRSESSPSDNYPDRTRRDPRAKRDHGDDGDQEG